tara:strand:- start:685 stop:1008 length:324 start_codon:yes stop_codon:yes gene_type:complete
MEIYCKYKDLLDRAVEYSKKLSIDHHNCVLDIKRLPPSFKQQGLIEHPRKLEGTTYLNIYIRMNDERYVTLAHEMVHAKQVLNGEELCEHEAYLREKTLDNDPQKIV